MKYINNDKFLDTTKEVSEDKNFEHLYFAFLNEEKKKLKDDNKWNSKPFVIFDYKFCELLLKLNRVSNIKNNDQFKLWNFETFFNFHKEYNIDEMSELINLTELDSSYDIDDLISMGTSRCRRLFKEYYHFEVSDTLLTYENLLNKNLFYDVKQIDGFVNNHEDTNFVVFRNGIMFEKSQVIYLFTKEYTVVKDYKNDCTSVFQDGSPVCFENIESLFEKENILKKSPIYNGVSNSIIQKNEKLKNELSNEVKISKEIQNSIYILNGDSIHHNRASTLTDALFESEFLSRYEDCFTTDQLLKNIFGVKLNFYQETIWELYYKLMSEKYNSETNAYQLNDNESVHANIYSYSDGTDIKIISFNTKQFIYSIVLNYYSRRPLISIYCIDNHYQPKNIFYSQFENYKSDKELKEICDLGTINFICSQLNGNTILESKIKEVGKLEECLGLINQASCYFE